MLNRTDPEEEEKQVQAYMKKQNSGKGENGTLLLITQLTRNIDRREFMVMNVQQLMVIR